MLIQTQKKNLGKLLERYSFEHLRPQPEVFQIEIPQQEYFMPPNTKERRKIYYKVQYQLKQLDAIEEVKQSMAEKGIKHKLPKELILKHIYGGKWNINKTVERLTQVMDYQNNENITKFNHQTIKRLQDGSIYTYGIDKGLKPIVIMRIDKFDLKTPIQQHFNTIYYMMLVVMGFKMVPYHAEKYTMIMDFNDIALTDIPYTYLYDALDKMNTYYCGNSERTFVFRSAGINNIWRMVSFFLSENQRRRIIFINKGQQSAILQHISEYQLQKKYGGKLPNLQIFWPPQNTNEQFDVNLNSILQESFYSVENNDKYFEFEPDPHLCGKLSCQCNIF